jgi:L-aspartate oxidase
VAAIFEVFPFVSRETFSLKVNTMKVDFLVVGSGIAGLSFALKSAQLGSVCVVTKKSSADTATNLAQGGVAAVLAATDSFASHVQDTLMAGDGLCDEHVVHMVVEDGPARIAELEQLGVKFSREKNGHLSLGKEGGHSQRRVAHAYDLTGHEIEQALVSAVLAKRNISLLENHMCVDLLVKASGADKGEDQGRVSCHGAYVMAPHGQIIAISARVVVLCTGGAGKVYLYTSNPDIATGDGVALAARAGARISNMEFVQFHPTCLFHPQAKNFLISEAVRGEGGLLVNHRGERFMLDYEPDLAELATRDKVARAIDTEMKKTGEDCVFLDITHQPKNFLQTRFPTIYQKCLSLGIDMSVSPIPVVPAAHYLCGGVTTNLHGETTVKSLFALGETACTGLHGGNRLASNSLLEAVVFAEKAFKHCESNWDTFLRDPLPDLPAHSIEKQEAIEEEILINHNWDVIRRVMWNYVGIVRKRSRLLVAQRRIEDVRVEIDDILNTFKWTPNMLELRNISMVASLIITACLARKESCGLHFIIEEKGVSTE